MGTNRGKKFEAVIEEAFKKLPDVQLLRIPDQTTHYKGSTNPCDIIVYHKPYLYTLELKSVHGNIFPIYSKPKKDKNGRLYGFYGNITDFQWEQLLKMSTIKGVTSGVIVWFIDKDETVFFDINLLQRWRTAGHKSIHSYPEWLEHVKGKHDWCYLTGRKKRIFYEYDMKKFLWEMEHA